MSKFPDLGSHYTGWTAAKIDGVWCVGQRGNLDTTHDATLRITGGFLDDNEAEQVANWLVEQYNAKLINHLAFRAGVHDEQMEKAYGHLMP
jgi:hypothetical protein